MRRQAPARRSRLFSTLALSLWGAALLVAGCAVSPMPLPPSVEPPDLAEGSIVTIPCLACDSNAVSFSGPPGAVSHPEITEGIVIWIVPLDSVAPPATFPVAEDGSFLVYLEGGDLGSIFRMQAWIEEHDVRSAPFDVVVTTEAEEVPTRPLEHPLSDCFALEPGPELELEAPNSGDRATIILVNDCSEALAVDFARLRAPSTAFELIEQPGESLEPNASSTMTVEFLGEEPGLYEELVIVQVSGAEPDLNAVTLRARLP